MPGTEDIRRDVADLLRAFALKHPRFHPAGRTCPACGGAAVEKSSPGAWRCPECRAGGTVLEWVALQKGIPLREAAAILARSVEMSVPPWTAVPAPELGEALKRAQGLFRKRRSIAAEKLASRKAPQAALERGRMGWCPPNLKLRHPASTEAGLRRPRGRPHLAGRVTIPLHDVEGRLVGFTGWLPPGGGNRRAPKYLDTRATEIYRRNRVVYNLHRALPAMREMGWGILVEGIFDCWAVVSLGFPNVAALRTCRAGEEQTALLRGVSPRWIVALDGNRAGLEGARATARALGPGAGIARIPEDTDPDEMVRNGGGCKLREMLIYKKKTCPSPRHPAVGGS